MRRLERPFEIVMELPAGYTWQNGAVGDRRALCAVMQQAYREQFPTQATHTHLEQAVNTYLSAATPLWWLATAAVSDIGCLWLGQATDQASGERYTHIFLLYVRPEHRRRGLGTALFRQAETWARRVGDRQLGFNVFARNRAALRFYQQHDCQTQSLLMIKNLI